MAVLRWDPWGELATLQRDVSELFNRDPGTRRVGSLVPPIDAYRTDEGMVVLVELPGIGPDQVDVSVQDGVLTLSGERPVPADIEAEAWVRRERASGAFERSFTLPEGTRPDQIQASFDNGLLELRIPHPPEQRPHKVEIGVGSETANRSAVDVGGSS
ncbi:MAG: Hsp20/alpha crystallin family protein [Actinomycetota bacterium]|nr:Hsp20/alpha crystallin family protein [Actinomycetota bacterium]